MTWIRRVLPLCLVVLLVIPAAAQERSDTVVIHAGEPRYPGVASVTTELTIGVVDGALEYLFDEIGEILVARDGTIWVLETRTGSPRLRQYDATGRYLRTVARRGGGPGELMRPAGMALLRDGRVIVRDSRANFINAYTADGRPDTTWTLRTRYREPGGGRDGLRVDTAGFVWMPFSTGAPLSGSASFLRLRGNGAIIDTVPAPELPEAPGRVTFTSPGMIVHTAPPYAPRSDWWWSPSGHFVTGISNRYAIELRVPRQNAAQDSPATWSPGDPVISIRRDAPPVTLSGAERRDFQAYFDRRVSVRQGTPSGPIPEVPRTKPFYKSVTVAEDGRLWVNVSVPSERVDPPDEMPPGVPPDEPMPPFLIWREPMMFDVFEPDGVYVGRVALPGSADPSWIGGDVIWAVYRDENDVQFARKLRVDWAG